MPDNKELFNKLHFMIMLCAEDWAKCNTERPRIHALGELRGAVSAWFVVANHYELPGRMEIYAEYKALSFVRKVV